MLSKVIDCYHATLKQSAAALAFLKELGFRAEAIERFKLGFVDRTLESRLPERNRKAGRAIRRRRAASDCAESVA